MKKQQKECLIKWYIENLFEKDHLTTQSTLSYYNDNSTAGNDI